MVYPTAAAISLGEMDHTIENVQWKTWVADGATVYVEKDGIGHVYLEVNNTVFSYGRYDGSYSPSSGAFGPVGPGILNKKPHSYAVERMKKSPTSVYNFPDADASKIYIYLNNLYNSGVSGKNGGMSIDTYLLIGNNCTTITCSALQVGGVNMSMTQTPFSFNMNMQYPNQFPSGMPPR